MLEYEQQEKLSWIYGYYEKRGTYVIALKTYTSTRDKQNADNERIDPRHPEFNVPCHALRANIAIVRSHSQQRFIFFSGIIDYAEALPLLGTPTWSGSFTGRSPPTSYPLNALCLL